MRKRRLLALVLLACLALTACDRGEGGVVTSETSVVYGGTLNLSMAVPNTLNPLLAAQPTVRDALFAVYEPLIAVTAEQELRPILAESWAFNPDATALTVKLREGVRWHDGTELTAKDVVYTVNTIKQAADGPYSHLLRYVSAAAEAGPYSVTFNLNRSYSQLLFSLYFPIIPLNAGALDEAAVGTGPFRFENYNPGQSLSLVRSEDYRDGDAGFARIVFNIVREELSMASAFSTGVSSAVQSSVYDTDEFALPSDCRTKRACGSAFEYIGLNYRNPIFSSVTVRTAMSQAIDREEVVLDGYGSSAVAANIPMHPRSLRYSPALSLVDYNAAGAREALFYDGWADSGDGILAKTLTVEDENGESYSSTGRLSFTLLVNSENTRRVLAANIIASRLRDTGFDVTVEEASFDDYAARIEVGDFDAYLGGTDIGNLYDLEFLLASDGSQNYSGYSSEYMDAALASLASASDDESFTNACSIVQEVFTREQPLIGVAFVDDSVYLSGAIEGGTSPLFKSPFGNIGKWFFAE